MSDYIHKDQALEYVMKLYPKEEYIKIDKAFDYVMENMYDEVKERVFEQEADNRHE